MLTIITLKKIAEDSGYTQSALYKKISDGVFIEGVHYLRSPDRRIHFYITEYEKWLKTNYLKA